MAHGPDNRTALLRTLPGRFEWRLLDAAANPYLATAALIAAGLDEAVDALGASALMRAALGETPHAGFVRLKRAEWTAHARHVSDWEHARYGAMC